MLAKTIFKLLVGIALIIPSDVWAVADSILVNDLRIKLGQTTASNSSWTDAQLVRCFNMAQGYISGLGRAIETDTTAAGGALRISTPSDFITLKGNAYLWRNGAEIRPIPRVSMDSLNGVMEYMNTASFGIDRYVIAEDAGVVMVAPPLNSADSVRYSFYGRPATFADDGTANSFSLEWQQALLETAYVIALQKIASPLLPLAIQERDKLVGAMFQSLTLRPQLAARAQ